MCADKRSKIAARDRSGKKKAAGGCDKAGTFRKQKRTRSAIEKDSQHSRSPCERIGGLGGTTAEETTIATGKMHLNALVNVNSNCMCVQAREEKLQRENSAVKEKLKTVQGQMRAVVLKLERIEDKRTLVKKHSAIPCSICLFNEQIEDRLNC